MESVKPRGMESKSARNYLRLAGTVSLATLVICMSFLIVRWWHDRNLPKAPPAKQRNVTTRSPMGSPTVNPTQFGCDARTPQAASPAPTSGRSTFPPLGYSEQQVEAIYG